MEHEQLILPENLSWPQFLVGLVLLDLFRIVCSFSSFYIWPMCFLSCDLRFQITTLVSSNSSSLEPMKKLNTTIHIYSLEDMNKLNKEMYIWCLEQMNKLNTAMYILCLEPLNKLNIEM